MSDIPDHSKDNDDTSPTKEELLQWIEEKADSTCRNCDGTGIFYGNVGLCSCVNYTQYV